MGYVRSFCRLEKEGTEKLCNLSKVRELVKKWIRDLNPGLSGYKALALTIMLLVMPREGTVEYARERGHSLTCVREMQVEAIVSFLRMNLDDRSGQLMIRV